MSALQVVAAVAGLALAAFVLWRRRRLGVERIVLALLAALGLGVYASGVLSELPDPKQLIGDLAQALGMWTYALVGALAFLETGAFVGLVAPGETVVIAGGVIAGQGEIDLILLIGLVWTCAVLGDSTSFFIGRRLGRGFLERHGPKLKISHGRLEQVESYFERHGGKTILIGRFIGLVRALAPFIAGSSGLPYRRFIPYSVVGTGLWATVFCVLGYVFWQSFDTVAHIAGQAAFAFGVVAAVVVGAIWSYRQLRDPVKRRRFGAWVERQGRRPLLRPLYALARPVYRRLLRPTARFVAPQVRFLWHRITPGELGLELTTTLAIAGVGTYVFVLYTLILSADPGPTPLDLELLELGDRMRSAVAVDIVGYVSDLGALPAVATLVLLTSITLVVRGGLAELVALVAGLAIVYAAVQVAKAGVDRPRPSRALIETADSSFPSGHAAYATAWVAAAVAASWRAGIGARAALVLGALGVTAAVGLSRIYLRAHFWSDVAGGWGLGAGVFGALAIAALIVTHIRNNGPQRWTSTSQSSRSRSR